MADDRFATTESYGTSPNWTFPRVGDVLAGRYQIDKRLEPGGMGDVYLARDKPSLMGRLVVIKVLQEKHLRNEWSVIKFRQEIEALTRIKDPGVVGILDADSLPNGDLYLVMEFVEGENLRSQISREGMDLIDVADIVRQAGRTLHAAHACEVIHRDLKPENIMVRRDSDSTWHVKVIDFGIAKVRNSLVGPSTVAGHIAGTLAYMSPEQLRGNKVLPSCDVYALAVIAFEMITGRLPFNPRTPFELLELQEAGVQVRPKTLRPELSQTAENLILKALSYLPEDRHPTILEFAVELASALERKSPARSPIVSPQPSSEATVIISPTPHDVPAGQQLTHKRSKRKFAYIILALTLLLGVATVFVWLLAWRLPERSLTYWLTVQRMYEGKQLGKPFQATGQDYFHTGDTFVLNVATTEEGAFYALNEGRDSTGAIEWNIMFPTKANNSGHALISPTQVVKTGNFRFTGSTGVENVWLIWATEPVSLLDIAVQDAIETGVVQSSSQRELLESFLKDHETTPTELVQDEANERALLKGRGEIIVRRVTFSHKPN